MVSSDIRDILTCFSPSLDFFAISSGDGRIKIWDTVKSQLQTEFSDFLSTDETNLLSKSERGHLSVDYTCMKWVALDRKKRKHRSSFLVLGTGSGDVLAIDVSAVKLKWKFSDCHRGGVSSISFSKHISCVYTSGADGMVCEIEPESGHLLRKFEASTKGISSMSVSADGKILATAAGQMKIFKCSDHQKIQKFSGHPGKVRCIVLSADGKYALSCAGGERDVALWRVDGSKKQSATCILPMEHPAVYLDTWCVGNVQEDRTFHIVAISEKGVCYFWCAKGIDELQKTKPAKISLSVGSDYFKKKIGESPAICAAKIQNVLKTDATEVFLAHGFLVKPSFEKVVVQHGKDLELNSSQALALLQLSRSQTSKKRTDAHRRATALDRTNAEGALIPIPNFFEFKDFKAGLDEHQTRNRKDCMDFAETETAASMEDRLRSLGMLDPVNDLSPNSMCDSPLLKGIDLDSSISPKKMRSTILSMTSTDACKLLSILLIRWKSRVSSAKYVLPWVCCILVNHYQTLSEDLESDTLDSCYRIAKSRASASQVLLRLSGRLQLITAQVDKTSHMKTHLIPEDDGTVESDDEDIDEVTYGEEEDEYQTSSEDEA